MSKIREVAEGPQYQGEDEQIAWGIDITEWGSSPTGISVVVKDEDGNDVTSTVTTGSPSAVDSTTIKTPVIHSLTAGTQYRVEVLFTVDTQILECYFILIAEE